MSSRLISGSSALMTYSWLSVWYTSTAGTQERCAGRSKKSPNIRFSRSISIVAKSRAGFHRTRVIATSSFFLLVLVPCSGLIPWLSGLLRSFSGEFPTARRILDTYMSYCQACYMTVYTLIFLQTAHSRARNAKIRGWRVSTSNHRIFQRMSGGCSRPSGARRSPRMPSGAVECSPPSTCSKPRRHRDADRSAWRTGRRPCAWSFHAASSSSPGTSRHPTARTASRRRSMSPNARSAVSRGSSASTDPSTRNGRRDAEHRRVACLVPRIDDRRGREIRIPVRA